MKATFKELQEKKLINGLDELSKIEGTRTDIYNAIIKYNKLAIIDCKQSKAKINDVEFLVLLKKVSKGIFKIDCFWDLTNVIEIFENNLKRIDTNLYFNK